MIIQWENILIDQTKKIMKEEIDGIPDWHSNLQIREHTVCNHMEPKGDHSQHPMPQEMKCSVSLYQSTCNVTYHTEQLIN